MPQLQVQSPEDFRQQLLEGMGEERGNVTSHVHASYLVPGQIAAVWFSDNRLNDGRRVCVILRGSTLKDVGLVHDLAPGAVETKFTDFIELKPSPLSLSAVSRSVLYHLFGR